MTAPTIAQVLAELFKLWATHAAAIKAVHDCTCLRGSEHCPAWADYVKSASALQKALVPSATKDAVFLLPALLAVAEEAAKDHAARFSCATSDGARCPLCDALAKLGGDK